MQEVLDRGVEIDRCHEGHGIYFDRGEVERFVGADPGLDSRLLAAANRQATRSDVACCGCARPMLVFQSALVAAHLCQYCGGTWIDGQSLPQVSSLLAAPRAAGAALEPRPQVGGGRNHVGALGFTGSEAGLGADIAVELAAEGGWAAGEWLLDGGAGDALEVVADAGGSLLELVGEIIGGILEGL